MLIIQIIVRNGISGITVAKMILINKKQRSSVKGHADIVKKLHLHLINVKTNLSRRKLYNNQKYRENTLLNIKKYVVLESRQKK